MKKISVLLVLLITSGSLLMSSCSVYRDHLEREKNQANIKKVDVGMTKEEVRTIMGEPLIHQKYNKPNIWFYYTQIDWFFDNAITSTECTPVLFKNNKVTGIGLAYYWDYLHRNWEIKDKDTGFASTYAKAIKGEENNQSTDNNNIN